MTPIERMAHHKLDGVYVVDGTVLTSRKHSGLTLYAIVVQCVMEIPPCDNVKYVNVSIMK